MCKMTSRCSSHFDLNILREGLAIYAMFNCTFVHCSASIIYKELLWTLRNASTRPFSDENTRIHVHLSKYSTRNQQPFTIFVTYINLSKRPPSSQPDRHLSPSDHVPP